MKLKSKINKIPETVNPTLQWDAPTAGGKIREYWHILGPGLTTGAADDDPSGIATYSQAGSAYGYQFTWTALFTFPFMVVVQEMCARIGIVTGRGLAGVIARHYSKKILLVLALLLFAANTFNIAANLGVMAKAVQLLVPEASFALMVVLFAFISLYLEIFISYRVYARFLKWAALVLLSYVAAAFLADIDWSAAISSLLVPSLRFDKEGFLILTAILGTTISPYLFFWQTSQEVEEQILSGKTSIKQRQEITTPAEIQHMRADVTFGMLLSNVVMFFIIVLCAGTLYANGITQITDASDAALALKPLAGEFAFFLFGLGIIGTGMLAIPILAGSSSYALSESFGWREGLYRKFKQAHAFYGVIIVSLVLGLALNFFHFDVIKMLIYSAVLNGLIAPLVLVMIVLISSNGKIMKEWKNHPAAATAGWLVTILMGLVAAATIGFLIWK